MGSNTRERKKNDLWKTIESVSLLHMKGQLIWPQTLRRLFAGYLNVPFREGGGRVWGESLEAVNEIK
jgi:hypothetical protein